jgi:alkanesulfonate monooxygenase SsuD/methylene tetrahydromethanopterin reductase-like flavin-dependent oxidoreductase (luciferase family)
VRAIKALYGGVEWDGGSYVPPMTGPLLPPPVRPGGPPIWIGGFADAVVRLAAAEADAWNGWGMGVEEFTRKVQVLREAAERPVSATWAGIVVVGRDDDEVGRLLDQRSARGLEPEVWSGTTTSLRTHLDALAAAGSTWSVLVPGGPPDRFDVIAEEVLPGLRSSA